MRSGETDAHVSSGGLYHPVTSTGHPIAFYVQAPSFTGTSGETYSTSTPGVTFDHQSCKLSASSLHVPGQPEISSFTHPGKRVKAIQWS